MFIHVRAIRTAQITDGLSTAAFASERLVSMPVTDRPDRRRDLMVCDHHDTPDIASGCIAANQGDTAKGGPGALAAHPLFASLTRSPNSPPS